MAQYLLTIYENADAPGEGDMAKIGEVAGELAQTGRWTFGGGLQPSDAATVRPGGAEALITDGPYIEGKEHIVGVLIIDCADRDEALGWAKRFADARGLPVEVSPVFQG
jgi:hypothetical protein